MKTLALVVSRTADIAVVEVERQSACEGCHKAADGESCTVCTLMGGTRKFTARAYNAAGAEVGDRVAVESRTGRVLGYAALVFLLPVVLALLCWGVATLFTQKESLHLVFALLGFFASFAGLFCYSKALQRKRPDMEITQIVTKHSLID